MIKPNSLYVLSFAMHTNSIGFDSAAPQSPGHTEANVSQTCISELKKQLEVGDIVFIRAKAPPFKKVAETTNSWTNHVGIVVEVSRQNVLVAESTFPFSKVTTLDRFVRRSEAGRAAVMRLRSPLTKVQQEQIRAAAVKRLRTFYDTGFNLHSPRQFCSRFVREILAEATGIQVGETETFADLLATNPSADQHFWKLWYFGKIPWHRETVTPARVLESPELRPVFDGFVV